jgi:tryptophan-rich sensory protein
MSGQGVHQTGLSQALALGAWLVVCFAAAGVGSLATRPAIDTWYAGIAKPEWTPPNWLFGPVWTALYLSMAVAAWLVWRRAGLSGAWLPLTIFGVHLALNALWSILFFGMGKPGLAFAEIILLWASILATILSFYRVVPAAGLILIPYLLWVSFASALNFAIWRLNS